MKNIAILKRQTIYVPNSFSVCIIQAYRKQMTRAYQF